MAVPDGASMGGAAGERRDVVPAVTVDQMDVRDGSALRWTFHTSGGVWWDAGGVGDRAEPADSLRAALRASDALDPLPWHVLVIDASPHTADVLAELAPRIVGRGERAVLEVAWHPSVDDVDGMDREHFANQSTWCDTEVPVLLDGQMCGALAGPGGPFAFRIHAPDESMQVSVVFHAQWINIEVLSDRPCDVVAGELAPGRFVVERTEPDCDTELVVDPEAPVGHAATVARLRRVLEEAVGLDDLSLLDRFVVKDDGGYFRGSFASAARSASGRVEFEGNARGPGVDLVRMLAQEREAASRTD